MPADRSSKGSRRGVPDGAKLTWTTPVEPTTAQSISFAPNLTPVTFNEPPPIVETGSALFPPTADCPTTRRQGHGQKKPENHIPRPPNAFILFRSSFIKNQHVSTEVETNHSTLSKIIGLTWQNLPHDERQVWHAKAKAALDEHKRRYPQYAFRPMHSKGKGPEKRKVREVGPKDIKRCEKIAELLVEGMKGQELDAAIKEFDLHHVPEVVTRFEAPLTARMYRRSSSVPAPNTEHKSQPAPKIRASSSQPTPAPAPVTVPSPAPTEPDSETFYDNSFSPPFTPSYASSPAFSFPPTPEATPFDFGSFSFDQPPCAEVPQTNSGFELYSQPEAHHRNISPLDTSSLLDDSWTRSSSPSSSMPTTPESYSAPSSMPPTPESYSALQSPCLGSVNPFAAFESYNQCPMPDLRLYGDGTSHHQLNFGSFGKDGGFASSDSYQQLPNSKPTYANLDMAFTAFMACLPPPAYPM